MARLTKAQWEEAKALFEIDGQNMSQIARAFGVSEAAVRQKAKAEVWKKGKTSNLIAQKVASEKEIQRLENETSKLTVIEKKHLDKNVDERLREEGLRSNFHCELYQKGRQILKNVETPSDWKTMTSGAKDLNPQKDTGTTVNVGQQAIFISPKAAMEQVLGQIDVTDAV